MNRENRASLAKETLDILQQGTYLAPSGRSVDISKDVAGAIQHSRLYRPSDFPTDLPLAPPSYTGNTHIEVTPETTLEAAHRLALVSQDADVLCLNFASARNPGGGFLGGSQAQEESLARSSGLYPCLMPMTEMYEVNRRLPTCLYSDHMIYSPHVPVFRADSGLTLEQPYLVSFLSVPAVNAGAVRRNEPDSIPLIQPTMQQRAARLLWIAAQHNYPTLILGAWGCGVFANDPGMVADIFARELLDGGRFEGQFHRIVFAVYDRSETHPVVTTFRRRLTPDNNL